MKKLFILGLIGSATLLVTSCSNDENVDMPSSKNAIEFSTFVDKPTRAEVGIDYTTENLTKFKVWGQMMKADGTGTLGKPFAGTEITGSKGNFSYPSPVYWEPGYNYNFLAVAPADNINTELSEGRVITVTPPTTVDGSDCGKITFTNNEGIIDLIAAYDGTWSTTAIPTTGTINRIYFTFKHLLARIKFGFVNELDDESTISITGVTITNSFKTGTVTINPGVENSVWGNCTGNTELLFTVAEVPATPTSGKTENIGMNQTGYTRTRYLIPVNAEFDPNANGQTYTVTFRITRKVSGQTFTSDKEVTVPTPNGEWKPGYSYLFTAKINAQNVEDDPLRPIKFDVTEVSEWTESGNEFSVEDPTPSPIRRK